MFSDSVEAVYGELMRRHRLAHLAGIEEFRQRIDTGIELMRDLWPKETAAWEARYTEDSSNPSSPTAAACTPAPPE
jgi:hypothetical protein